MISPQQYRKLMKHYQSESHIGHSAIKAGIDPKTAQLELSNNLAENAMRPVALGRRNWIHIGSEQAGPKVAAIASIVETCRRLDINL